MTTGPMSQVGCARACSTVTSASSSRRRPRNGPPDAVSTSRATSSRAAAAQALGERGVLGVDRDDLAGPRRRRHQRAARDQRLLVRQRQRRAGGQRGERRAQATGAGDPVEHGVRGGRGGELGGSVRTGEHVHPGQLPAQRGGRGPGPRRRRAARRAPRPAPRAARRPCRRPPGPTTRNRCGRAAMTSSACVPIEPVEPSTTTLRGLGDRSGGDRSGGGHRGHSARAVRRCGTTGPATMPVDEGSQRERVECRGAYVPEGGTAGRGGPARRAVGRVGVARLVPERHPHRRCGRRRSSAGAADRARTRRTSRTSGSIPIALGMLVLIVYGTVKRRNDWRK